MIFVITKYAWLKESFIIRRIKVNNFFFLNNIGGDMQVVVGWKYFL
jgi:hypothetical protein